MSCPYAQWSLSQDYSNVFLINDMISGTDESQNGHFSLEAGFHSGHAIQEIKAAKFAQIPRFLCSLFITKHISTSSNTRNPTSNPKSVSNMGFIAPSLS